MTKLTPAEKRKITIAKNKAAKALADAPTLEVPGAAVADIGAVAAAHVTASPGVDPAKLFAPPEANEKSRETALLDVIHGIMSTDNMNVKTVFEDKHIVAVTKGHIFADRYNSNTMRALIQVVSEVRVSKGGLGRKNLVKAITAVISSLDSDSEGDTKQHKRRLFGGDR